MIPLEELSGSVFGQREYECLENGEFLPIKAGVRQDIPAVPHQILSKCNEHYGLMDCVGFYEEPKEEPPKNVYFILSMKDYARLTVRYVLLKFISKRSVIRQRQEDKLGHKTLMGFRDVGYVAEFTSSKKFISHDSDTEIVSTVNGLLEGKEEFSSDKDAVEWFLSKLEV